MARRKKSPGRPTEISRKTVIASYNLTAGQKLWLKRQAEKRGLSASDFLRELVDEAMKG